MRGTVRMSLDVYRQFWHDERLNGLALILTPGADIDTVTADLRTRLAGFPQIQVNPSGALRKDALAVFDRTFAITAAMQFITTLVAFIGVLSSLLALQLEGAREMGILRALGLTIAEVRRLTFWETGLLGASAGLLALPTGYILAWILIFIINRRSFGWTLQMQTVPCALCASLSAGGWRRFVSCALSCLAIRPLTGRGSTTRGIEENPKKGVGRTPHPFFRVLFQLLLFTEFKL